MGDPAKTAWQNWSARNTPTRKIQRSKRRQETRRVARCFDIGEGLLELGLVLCSLYFLARKSFFPIFGVLASLAGTAMGIWGFLL